MGHKYLLKIIFMQNFIQQQVTEEEIVVESGNETLNEKVSDNENKKEEVDHQNTEVNIHEQMLKLFQILKSN